MLGAGVDPRTAAGRLGHDASVLLRIYGHMIPARDREAAEILGRLMSGGGDVPRQFGPGELNALLNTGAGPATPDDNTVLEGSDQSATAEDLRALAERLSDEAG
jgi:hypothetical protein